jgi:hypothetical protein
MIELFAIMALNMSLFSGRYVKPYICIIKTFLPMPLLPVNNSGRIVPARLSCNFTGPLIPFGAVK